MYHLLNLYHLLIGKPFSAAHQHLSLIVFGRVLLLVLAEVLMLVNTLFFHLAFNVVYAQAVLFVFVLLGVFSFVRLHLPATLTHRELLFNISGDVLIMTWFFHVTGGVSNPFVSLLLFPLTVSASMLPWRYAFFMVVLTLLSYGSLFLFATNLMSTNMDMLGSRVSSHFSLHIVGMWFNFAVSASLISFFVIQMSQQVRRQQQKLNQQRERALHDEQLLGIAAQAASAAHHMSMPLSTMSIIIEDLKHDELAFALSEDIQILSDQVNNCKHVLNKLRQNAQKIGENAVQWEPVNAFVQQCFDEFQLLRPEVWVGLDGVDQLLGYSVKANASLRMAILNVLNNSADASPEKIDCSMWIENNYFHLKIQDYGSGVPEGFEGGVLGPVTSDKPGGMGLGLFLSHASINLHGGQISLKSKAGTLTHISLPVRIDTEKQDQ